MIAFLRGEVIARTQNAAYIEVNGVGFEVGMSYLSLAALPEPGNIATIYTYLHVREDALCLYGFATVEEKELFVKLIGVTGVGPKVALAILSSLSPSELAKALTNQDVARLSKVPGIGKKTAQRIILDLKGTLDTDSSLFSEEVVPSATLAADGIVEALLSMGFTSKEADLALKGAPEGADESVLLQYALKRLGSF